MSFSSILMLFVLGVLAGVQGAIILLEPTVSIQDYILLGGLVAFAPVVVYTDPVRQAKKENIFS